MAAMAGPQASSGSPWSVTGDIGLVDSDQDPEGPWMVRAVRSATANTAGLAEERFRRSTFIIVSNHPTHTPRYLLRAYKHQYVIEQDNALVKGPLQIAPVFLKDTKKLEAYVYCVFLALLLWRCMEAIMRVNQALRHHLTLSQPAPTTKRLKEIIQPVQIIQWRDEAGRPQRRRSELSLVQRQALLLLGMDSRRFTQVPSG